MEKEGIYNDTEKEGSGSEVAPYNEAGNVIESKGIAIGEAAGVYGDLRTAEDLGYVTRGLVFAKGHHGKPWINGYSVA